MWLSDEEDGQSAKRLSRRTFILGAAQGLGFGALGWRAFQIQVRDNGRYVPLAEDNRISLQVLGPKRGRILDRAGRVLADNEENFRVTLTPAMAGDVPAVLNLLRRIVALTPEDAERIAKRGKKHSRYVPVVVASDLTFDQVARISVLAPQLPGVRTETAWRRRYAAAEESGHVVGYVGPVERMGVDDDAVLRLPDMRIGKSGAEAGFDLDLRGKGGSQKAEVDARGRTVRALDVVEPVTGADVALSIDQDLQRQVYERLQQEVRASCVALDVASGEIAVMVSTPGFAPSSITDGLDEAEWLRMSQSEDRPMFNRAIGGQYPPGSTFKIVTALAGLQAGMIQATDYVECDGHYELADQTFRCWSRTGHGRVHLHEALRSSCDVYFFEVARRLGIELLADTARMLGFGQVFDCGLPQQKAGLVPDPDWKRGKMNETWLGGETLLTGIGQGYVLSTPLQLAVAAARVATGRIIMPTLARRGAGDAPVEFATLEIDGKHLAAVRAGLHAVVNEEGGTGHNARIDGGPDVAGKTGTSQVNSASTDVSPDSLEWSQRDHALFIGYTPSQAPRYAIAAVVEHGGGGGAKAAPVVRDVLQMLLARDARDQRTGSAAPPSGLTKG